jgi:hypothetical protein
MIDQHEVREAVALLKTILPTAKQLGESSRTVALQNIFFAVEFAIAKLTNQTMTWMSRQNAKGVFQIFRTPSDRNDGLTFENLSG